MPTGYTHISGDLDAKPELLQRLDRLARRRGERWVVTSGGRSRAEQERLYANRHRNPYPVAVPGHSRHESLEAADVMINGRAIQDVVPAGELLKAGLVPLKGDAVHVELPSSDRPGTGLGDALKRAVPFGLGEVGSHAQNAGEAAGIDPAGAVTGAAGDVAKATVGALGDLVGERGARAGLYVVLVTGGVILAVLGIARVTGAKVPALPIPALRAAKATR